MSTAWSLLIALLLILGGLFVPTSADAQGRSTCVTSGVGLRRNGSFSGNATETCPPALGNPATPAELWVWNCSWYGPYVDGYEVLWAPSTMGAYFVSNDVPQSAISDESLAMFRESVYIEVTCRKDAATEISLIIIVDQNGFTVPQLRRQARAQVEPPDPILQTAPDQSQYAVVVQTPLWVWTDQPVTETASAGQGLVVTVNSHLERVDFTLITEHGNETWSCTPEQMQVDFAALGLDGDDLKEPDRFGACAHLIEHSSTGEPGDKFALEATSVWSFTWAINGTPQPPVHGTIAKTTITPVDAVEILIIEN